MELFTVGFPTALTLSNLLYCFIGVSLGTLIGVLPGIGPLSAVAMLLPISFYLDPTTALVLLAGIYYGGEYGGSITSILLNLPGSTSSAITGLDGHPLARQGKAGSALFLTTIASFVGGSAGILLLMFLAPLIVAVALSFGSADYFAVMLLALVAATSVAQGSPLKGLGMVVVGLLLGCVGTDINSGAVRFTGGIPDLAIGISLVAITMSLFGVTEIIASVNAPQTFEKLGNVPLRSMLPSRADLKQAILPTLRGTGVGALFGLLPGTGTTIASFLAYVLEKRIARDPSRFGKGAIEGIVAPESANNAAAQTAFIPTLTLGIPGSGTMAIMLGALMVHGITPGPAMISNHPQVFWGLIASFWIGNLMLVVLNIPLVGIWVKALQVPYRYMFPAVLCLICVGAYATDYRLFDVWLVLAFGLVGLGMRYLGFEAAPLLIGFVLGPVIEENFRRAMLLAHGDFLVLLQRPIAGPVLALTGVLLAWMVWSLFRARRRPAPAV